MCGLHRKIFCFVIFFRFCLSVTAVSTVVLPLQGKIPPCLLCLCYTFFVPGFCWISVCRQSANAVACICRSARSSDRTPSAPGVSSFSIGSCHSSVLRYVTVSRSVCLALLSLAYLVVWNLLFSCVPALETNVCTLSGCCCPAFGTPAIVFSSAVNLVPFMSCHFPVPVFLHWTSSGRFVYCPIRVLSSEV